MDQVQVQNDCGVHLLSLISTNTVSFVGRNAILNVLRRIPVDSERHVSVELRTEREKFLGKIILLSVPKIEVISGATMFYSEQIVN